jgi:hypothetical protein
MGGVPFWTTFTLSPGTIAYVLGLAVLGAMIVGVLPALKTTGHRMQAGLRQVGGATRLQLGATWTALIVVQVALAVAVLPASVFLSSQSLGQLHVGPGFPADEFFTTRLVMDWNTPSSGDGEVYDPAYAAQYTVRLAELVTRLRREPGVSAVTYATTRPGEEATDSIEIEGRASSSPAQVRALDIAPDFFDAFDLRIVAGRSFGQGDVDSLRLADAGSGRAAIVNRTFVQQYLGGGNAIGRRVRYTSGDRKASPEHWHEIVGVVNNLPANPILPREVEARMYHPLLPERRYPVRIFVRVPGGAPDGFGARLQAIGAALDPTLRLSSMITIGDSYRTEQMGLHWGALAFALVTASVLLLSSAGIYALMSFTVTRRRREIGIRSALGADQRSILRSIFSRAMAQIAAGIAIGAAVAGLLDLASDGELMGGHAAIILPTASLLMMLVGLLAALGPARRGLAIHPSEALREE